MRLFASTSSGACRVMEERIMIIQEVDTLSRIDRAFGQPIGTTGNYVQKLRLLGRNVTGVALIEDRQTLQPFGPAGFAYRDLAAITREAEARGDSEVLYYTL